MSLGGLRDLGRLTYRPWAVHPVRTKRSGTQGWVIALSAALVLTQGLATVHLALAPHVLCEHGEWVESTGAARESFSTEDLAGPALRTSDVAILDSVGEHNHCPVQASHRQWAPPSALVSSIVVAPDNGAARCHAQRRSASSQLVLLLAPKQSPPA